MIKKLLLFILCVFLGYGIYNAATKGVDVFGTKVKPYSQLATDNETLDTKIGELEKLNDITYPQTTRNLQSAKRAFAEKENEYESLALSASPEEIAEANKREQFLLDYLWMKVGSYANADNVKIKIAPSSNPPMIEFDVTGEYISVVNFIYDIENDTDLSFNVDNIVMQGGSADTVTKATFNVTGVNVVTAES